MDGSRHSVGKAGEDAAAAYLESLGHEILDRGWRNGHLEVDIISETGKYLHFVEVKTRFCPEVTPASAVNRAKMLNMCRAARAYLAMHPASKEVRFDVVAVSANDRGGAIIEYIEDAFLPFF